MFDASLQLSSCTTSATNSRSHYHSCAAGGDPHSPTYSAPRVVLSLQQGASLTLTEEFNALQQLNGSYFANSVLEASLACNSSLSHR